MLDCVVKGGFIVDGTGAPGRSGDLGISDGRIVSVGGRIDDDARLRIDADGALVTPGWVDVHTHYDGQVLWDDAMLPSADNGVTTVITGNCGVGFAPVRAGADRELIELMEGVEDIPGTALYEGMPWGEWETFSDYLDLVGSRSYALDIGTQVAHGAVRYYAMGERACCDEDAAADDIEAMARIVEEAVRAGALGFSTSRTVGHRSLWGTPVPGTFAASAELGAIAAAMAKVGRGVFEAIPAGTVGQLAAFGGERFTQQHENELLAEVSRTSGRAVTFTLVQSPDFDPDLWKEILCLCETANRQGARLYPQVSSRPIGLMASLSSYHPFMRKPTYLKELSAPATAERARRMRDPEMKAKLLAEVDVPPEASGSMENLYRLFKRSASSMFPLDDPVDYEPAPGRSIGALAAGEGRDPLEYLYDMMVEGDGSRVFSLSSADPHRRMEVLREMLMHPDTVTGLSDAGAHVMLICDGTMPTTQLTHWTRDRRLGEKIPVEWLVHKQTARNAALYGLDDRGELRPGMRADVNVIDMDNLAVAPPVAHHDLPSGGMRLIQPVRGYLATFCNGVQTRDHDVDTGARPGRLVRGG